MRGLKRYQVGLVVCCLGYCLPAICAVEPTLSAEHIAEWDPKGLVRGSLVPGTETIEGEVIDLRTGTLRLNRQDLAIPGNGGQAIALSRKFGNREPIGKAVPTTMGNWELDLPTIVGNRTQSNASTDNFCQKPWPGDIAVTQTAESQRYDVESYGWHDTVEENLCSYEHHYKFVNGAWGWHYQGTDCDELRPTEVWEFVSDVRSEGEAKLYEGDVRTITYRQYIVNTNTPIEYRIDGGHEDLVDSPLVPSFFTRTWAGLTLNIPGEGPKSLLLKDGIVTSVADIAKFSDDTPVEYITTDNWTIKCVNVGPRVKAGFEARAPDGRVFLFTKDAYPNIHTKQEFPAISRDVVIPPGVYEPAQDRSLESYRTFGGTVIDLNYSLFQRRTNILANVRYDVQNAVEARHRYTPVNWLATEVTDRNGNKVYYDYEPVPDSTGKPVLSKIRGIDSLGGDQREISFSYKADVAGVGKLLDNASSSGRSVSYFYDSQNNLQRVAHVDGTETYCYYGSSSCAATDKAVGKVAGEMEYIETRNGGRVGYLYNVINGPTFGFSSGDLTVLRQRTVTDSTVTPAVVGTWTYELIAPFNSSDYPGATAGVTERQTAMRIKSPGMEYLDPQYWGYYAFAATPDWKRGLLRFEKNNTFPTYYDWRNVRKAGNGFLYAAPAGEHVVAPLTVRTEENSAKQLVTYQYPTGESYGLPEKVTTEAFSANILEGSRVVSYEYDNKTANGKYILGLPKSETYEGLSGNNRVVRVYDANGNTKKEERFAAYDNNGNALPNTGSVTDFTYFSTGDLETQKDPRGYTTCSAPHSHHNFSQVPHRTI